MVPAGTVFLVGKNASSDVLFVSRPASMTLPAAFARRLFFFSSTTSRRAAWRRPSCRPWTTAPTCSWRDLDRRLHVRVDRAVVGEGPGLGELQLVGELVALRDAGGRHLRAVVALRADGERGQRVGDDLGLPVEPERRAGGIGVVVLLRRVPDGQLRVLAALLREEDGVEAGELPLHGVADMDRRRRREELGRVGVRRDPGGALEIGGPAVVVFVAAAAVAGRLTSARAATSAAYFASSRQAPQARMSVRIVA